MSAFSTEVFRWAEKAGGEMTELHRAVILKLFNAVIDDTPVGNPDLWQSLWKDSEGRAIDPPEGYVGGILRGSWMISSNAPASGVVEIADPSGNVAKARVQDHIAGLADDKDFSVFLTNNQPYAYRIEYDGHSRQAPKGMVRKNVARITDLLAAAS